MTAVASLALGCFDSGFPDVRITASELLNVIAEELQPLHQLRMMRIIGNYRVLSEGNEVVVADMRPALQDLVERLDSFEPYGDCFD